MTDSKVNYADLANNTASSWWKDPGLRKSMIYIFISYCVIFSLGYDGSLLNGLQGLNQWQTFFGRPTGTTLGLIAASYYLPKIPCAFVIPPMVDRFGRKFGLYIGAFFMLAGAVVGGSSTGVGQLVGSRVLLGIGTAFGQVTASAYVPELAHPRLRHLAGSFLNCTYFIGSILSSWLTFAMVFYPNATSNDAWRIPTYIQGLGPAILAIGVWFVPESPRWLIKKGRAEEAHQILARLHANGLMEDELVLHEMTEIRAQIEIEKISQTSSWLTFFNTSGNRRRFFIVILLGTLTQWAGNGIINYYLAPILRQVGITQPAQINGLNGGLSIFGWLCAMTGASLVEKFGRKKLFLTSILGMLACMVCMTGVAGSYANTQNRATGIAIVPFIYLFQAAYSLALTPIPVLYTPEISPLSLRAKANALLLLSQAVSQTFNQFANPIALANIQWKYYIVYDVILVLYFVLVFLFLRETRGLSTEEASVVYDSDRVKAAALQEERRLAAQALENIKNSSDHEYDKKAMMDHAEKA